MKKKYIFKIEIDGNKVRTQIIRHHIQYDRIENYKKFIISYFPRTACKL